MRAAMLPTFAPGGASRATVELCPTCWCLPPPCGWTYAACATPRTIGYLRPFDRDRRHLPPALMSGRSVTPPPASVPIIARFFGLSVANRPDGSFIVTPSSLCEKTVAEPPADFAIVPPSPNCRSTLHTVVPSGMFCTLTTLPSSMLDFRPKWRTEPTRVPSTAGTYAVLPVSKTTFASGASRPRSWTRSTTLPSCCSERANPG